MQVYAVAQDSSLTERMLQCVGIGKDKQRCKLAEFELDLEAQATIERYLDQIDPVINQQRYAPLLRAYSRERVRSYSLPNEPLVKTLARYRRDVRLRGEICQIIHFLEVPLRNSLNEYISKEYGKDWMIAQPSELLLSPKVKNMLTRILERFNDNQKQSISNNDIVVRTTMEFWIQFFELRYVPSLWQRVEPLDIIFPYLSSNKYSRQEICFVLRDIKLLRNRASHQWPIWNIPEVVERIKECRVLIHGIEPNALAELDLIDRFLEVWQEKI